LSKKIDKKYKKNKKDNIVLIFYKEYKYILLLFIEKKNLFYLERYLLINLVNNLDYFEKQLKNKYLVLKI